MIEQDRPKSHCLNFKRIRWHFLAICLLLLASCQGFPGTAANSGTGLFGDDVVSTVVKGMSPSEEPQLKQHRLALQIKKAGGEVNSNLALDPASTIVGVDLHRTQITYA